MKLHRFIGNFDLANSLIVSTDRELVNQLRNVLLLSVADKVILSNGDGNEVLTELDKISKDEVIFRMIERRKNSSEPEREVQLFCSVLKKENFELVCQKATECGIKEIVPVISNRTVKTGLKIERLEKIIKEAAEQSSRGLVPKLEAILSLPEAFERAKKNDINLFFDGSGSKLAESNMGNKIGIFIGPEGGWTKEELELAKNNNCQIVSLGSLTLRGETAAIVASYLAVNKID